MNQTLLNALDSLNLDETKVITISVLRKILEEVIEQESRDALNKAYNQ
jgi:hypothetical protein